MSASNYVHLEVEKIIAETDRAFLLRIVMADGETVNEVWVPRSQIAEDEEYAKDDENVEISVTEWFCKKEGIDCE